MSEKIKKSISEFVLHMAISAIIGITSLIIML